MKILVTGHKGFIGSDLMEKIEADGMDLIDGKDVCDGIKGNYDVIVHLASFMLNEDNLFYNNINSTVSVAEYCRVTGAKPIFASSAAVYGNAEFCPTKETCTRNSINEYGYSKVVCENIIGDIPWSTILRLSNVIGKPGSVFDQTKNNSPIIYGDGTQIRDFVSLDRVVSAIRLCIYNDISGTYNVSSGIGTSINKLFEMYGLVPKYKKARKNEIHTSVLDNTEWRKVENLFNRPELL